MKVGLIDVDGHYFPNLALMKLSAYHKSIGDQVEWFNGFFEYDRVYMSKIFDFTEDFDLCIRSKEIVKGGRAYDKKKILPPEIESTFPDYSLYGITDTAYGYLTRGCPRGCSFCDVINLEGNVSRKAANLNQFWNGQKNIVLLDPNITACKEWKILFDQLIDSKAYVDFSQGIDARTLTIEKIEKLKQIKLKHVHFALDNPKDTELVIGKLKMLYDMTGWKRSKVSVYVLVNYGSTIEEDLDRIYKIKEIGFNPYVMVYDKYKLPKKHVIRKLQRYVNNKFIFWSDDCKTFDDYLSK